MAAGAIKNTVKSVIIEEDFTSIEIKNDFLREIETIKVIFSVKKFRKRKNKLKKKKTISLCRQSNRKFLSRN